MKSGRLGFGTWDCGTAKGWNLCFSGLGVGIRQRSKSMVSAFGHIDLCKVYVGTTGTIEATGSSTAFFQSQERDVWGP